MITNNPFQICNNMNIINVYSALPLIIIWQAAGSAEVENINLKRSCENQGINPCSGKSRLHSVRLQN